GAISGCARWITRTRGLGPGCRRSAGAARAGAAPSCSSSTRSAGPCRRWRNGSKLCSRPDTLATRHRLGPERRRAMLDLLIRNGQVVTPQGAGAWEIAVQDGKIVAVAAPGTFREATRVIDAGGK